MMDADDRAEMLDALGLGEGAARFVQAAYHLLGSGRVPHHRRQGEPGVDVQGRVEGARCAGVIHGDLERGFIRSEVIRWDELLEIGSWNKAKDLGKIRVEGKDYEVQDGDVLDIRHNS